MDHTDVTPPPLNSEFSKGFLVCFGFLGSWGGVVCPVFPLAFWFLGFPFWGFLRERRITERWMAWFPSPGGGVQGSYRCIIVIEFSSLIHLLVIN